MADYVILHVSLTEVEENCEKLKFCDEICIIE